MARTPSTMLDLGTRLPEFSLSNPEGEAFTTENLTIPHALVVMFICNHCPFVIHVQKELVALTQEYSKKDIQFVGINSNDSINYPDDGPEKMITEKKRVGYSFPYVFDKSQSVAKQFRAACTPDFYIFGKQKKLIYRGQMDDSRPGNDIPPSGSALKNALDAVLSGTPVSAVQKTSLGCNIKWIPGNEPDYFG